MTSFRSIDPPSLGPRAPRAPRPPQCTRSLKSHFESVPSSRKLNLSTDNVAFNESGRGARGPSKSGSSIDGLSRCFRNCFRKEEEVTLMSFSFFLFTFYETTHAGNAASHAAGCTRLL